MYSNDFPPQKFSKGRNTMKKPFMLMILDGYGLKEDKDGNAIIAANTPNLDRIFDTYPHTKLAASGMAVGLPEGQMGNSEVGHLNIGAGRIVYQELTRITKAIGDGVFAQNTAINEAIEHAKNTGGSVHVMGLMSDGGVHSHIEHIKATLALAASKGAPKVYLHSFMDGRDVPPTSGAGYIKEMESFVSEYENMAMGVVSGRYYAMDRDKRWDRVKLAYDALTLCKGRTVDSASAAMEYAYNHEETDEFVMPTVCCSDAAIKDGDSIIFCNFRPDRAREITRAFVDDDFDGFERTARPADLYYVCMTQYDATMPNVHVAFPPASIDNTLGAHLAHLGKTQLRIAETEKYAHVTFFFNGGVEAPNDNEDRILVPSPQVATYDLQPEMSAHTVASKVVDEIEAGKYDCIILNFANPDMVGHTGDFNAAVKALEAVDECVGKVVTAMLEAGGQMLITADHGNADDMFDADGNVITAHSTNPVPLVYIAADTTALAPNGLAEGGKLCDIAPTMLTLMGLPIPDEMTGRALI